MILFEKPDIEKAFNEIREYIKICEDSKNKALHQLEEYNKEEKIQELQKTIQSLQNDKNKTISFNLSEEETHNVNIWKKKHIEEKHNNLSYSGAIGGKFTYEFIPTSIGIIGTIKCSCGEEFCFCEL